MKKSFKKGKKGSEKKIFVSESSSEDEVTKMYQSVFRRNDPDLEENQAKPSVRVYEAKFKIPKNANLGEMMNAKSLVFANDPKKFERYANDQKLMGRYKRFVSYSTLFLMAVAFAASLFMIIYNWVHLHNGHFYVARTKESEIVEIDFEPMNITKVRYFLYRNMTEGASDINAKSNYQIVDNATKLCANEGQKGFAVQQIEDIKRITAIRDNLYSPFMYISEIYVVIQIVICAFLCLIYFPFRLKEYQIPLILRKSKANVFFDYMRIKIIAYVYFLIMVGTLPHFMFYVPNDKCLHTVNEADFGINWTDYYQFCLIMSTWIVSIPIIIYVIGRWLNDNFRFCMYPLLVANLVFLFGEFVLSFIVLIFALYRSYSYWIAIIVAYDLFVLVWAIFWNAIYECKFANKDLLRSESEEIH